MKALELYTDQEIQALQKTILKRFEMIEETIGADEQGVKVQGQDLALLAHVRVRDDLPSILVTYPVISSDKPSSTKYPKGFKECKYQPIGINDGKEIKQAIVCYDFHSPFVRWKGENVGVKQ